MLDWLVDLSGTNPIAHTIGLIALVCAVGMAIGSIKFQGIGLGSAGVLFIGILVAHYSSPIEKQTLDFVREFGLVLFVFAIGLQLGPSFFESLRQEGLRLNLLAAALVITGGLMTALLGWWIGLAPTAFAGLFAGASTNSPALGAAQQTLASMPGVSAENAALPALACAVTYPIAIACLLTMLVVLKEAFSIDPVREAEEYAEARRQVRDPIVRRTLVIENRNYQGLTLDDIYRRIGHDVVISRLRKAGDDKVVTALHHAVIHVGDSVVAVGTEKHLDQFEDLLGRRSEEDLLAVPAEITSRAILVTDERALGHTTAELELGAKFGVEVTRITRGDMEMTAVPGLRLQFGDVLQVVGTEEQLKDAANYLGNSLKKLNETQFIPLFAGILLGVFVGSMPIAIPGLAVPLRIGLAGGPLVVALLLGRIGHLGGLVWHMPQSANHAFREFGVALFFASLGLAAGDQFFAVVMSWQGAFVAGIGGVVTVTSLLAVGITARLVFQMNFVTLGGLLAGAMTNPPALSFANNLCRSEAPALAYATVYPLTTLLRIIVAQVLALLFF